MADVEIEYVDENGQLRREVVDESLLTAEPQQMAPPTPALMPAPTPNSAEIQVPMQIDKRESLIDKELAKEFGLIIMIALIGAYIATWVIGIFLGLTLHHTKKVLEWCGYK
jgi:hypothetical protein